MAEGSEPVASPGSGSTTTMTTANTLPCCCCCRSFLHIFIFSCSSSTRCEVVVLWLCRGTLYSLCECKRSPIYAMCIFLEIRCRHAFAMACTKIESLFLSRCTCAFFDCVRTHVHVHHSGEIEAAASQERVAYSGRVPAGDDDVVGVATDYCLVA